MREIAGELMHQRIAVQPPYFSFRRLYITSDSSHSEIYGEFEPEQPLGAEIGLLCAAEIGRHLAILGSCAAALTHDNRIYYLATQAKYKLLHPTTGDQSSRMLCARARVLERGRNTLRAEGEILTNNIPFAHLDVRYQVLSQELFERLFQCSDYSEKLSVTTSPYTQPLSLEYDVVNNGVLTAHSNGLLPIQCAGHFPKYPAWPVALMAYGIGQVSSHLIDAILQKPVKYIVKEVDIAAFRLISAITPLTFTARLRVIEDNGYEVECSVSANGKEVSRLNTNLSIVE